MNKIIMPDNQRRLSQVQKQILIRLVHAFHRNIKQPKSTILNHAINTVLDKTIHPNNFRTSCKTLEENGLIMRRKIDLDWYVNITPKGYDVALNLLDCNKS